MHVVEDKLLKNAAIIVAAGSGLRASAPGVRRPKQYAPIGGRPVLTQALSVYAAHPAIHAILVVIRPGDEALYAEAAKTIDVKGLLPAVTGGSTRQLSVLNGLRALKPMAPARVLIHDAARPFVSQAVIDRVLAALDSHKGAIAALPIADTLKRGHNGLIEATVDRASLWGAQTPQGFHFAEILAAHEAAAEAGQTHFSDDAAIAEWRGLEVALVEGAAENWKITTPEDLARAEREWRALNGESPPAFETRTGSGFDAHAFGPGDHVALCGVKIPHEAGLQGHSDADAPLHALTDALLGAIGAGDIGDHFPPSDPRWKGAASSLFLAHARDLIAQRGGHIINVDVTILAERPKIAPHREAMRACIAETLRLSLDRVGLKATTTEGLGFTGRREGLAAFATVSVSIPVFRKA